MTTKEQACFSNLKTPLEESVSGLDEKREMDAETDYDDLEKAGRSRPSYVEGLLWVLAVAGWSAIAYLHRTHPSFG